MVEILNDICNKDVYRNQYTWMEQIWFIKKYLQFIS